MSFEVEIKFRVQDHARLVARLAELGATPDAVHTEVDDYLAHPCRNLAQSDEALRVRQIGETAWITYKGPKLGGPTKTRREIEIAIGDGPEARSKLLEMFERLGFGLVRQIRKDRVMNRLTRHGRPLIVALDRVEGLGHFAEVEALAADQDDLAAAQAEVLALAVELGLDTIEPRSYLRMAIEEASPAPSSPGPP